MVKIFILLITFSCFSKVAEIGTLKSSVINTLLKRVVDVDTTFFSDSSSIEKDTFKVFKLGFNKPLGMQVLQLKKSELNSLRMALLKFQEWEKKAIQKGVTLEKKITDIRLKTMFTVGSKLHLSDKKNISLIFRSLNKKVHVLMIQVPELTSRNNQFIKSDLEMYMFKSDNVKDLIKTISDKNIKNVIKSIKEKQKIAEDFN